MGIARKHCTVTLFSYFAARTLIDAKLGEKFSSLMKYSAFSCKLLALTDITLNFNREFLIKYSTLFMLKNIA